MYLAVSARVPDGLRVTCGGPVRTLRWMHNPGFPPAPRVGAGVLAGVTLWRLVIATCAFTGFGAAAAQMNDPWPGLSQQASLLAGVVYVGLALYPLFTGGRAHEPRSPWLRGAMSVLLLL